MSDYLSRFENKLARVAVLFELPVDVRPYAQITGIGYGIFGDYGWAQRTKVIHRFAQEKLAAVSMVPTPIASCQVLGHRVTEYALFGFGFVYAFCFFADYYC